MMNPRTKKGTEEKAEPLFVRRRIQIYKPNRDSVAVIFFNTPVRFREQVFDHSKLTWNCNTCVRFCHKRNQNTSFSSAA